MRGSMGDAATRQTTSEQAEPAHAYDLFVVHATSDAEFVRGYLLPALNLPSSRVLLVDDLPLGGVIVAEVDRGVTESRFTVAVLSPAYLADRWAVFGEQLASHLSVDDTRIIPLRLTACDLPLRLNARVSVDFTDGARWDAEAGRLRDLVHATPPAPEPIACPYPGMRAFGAADVSRFFGRDPEVEELVGRLDRGERMIYVIGPSGSGKSSLVKAGLLPVIEAGSSRLGRTFVARTMRPGERPAERLAHTIDGDLSTPVQAIEAFVARHPPAERALVVIDQLEELFTMAAADERQRFIAALHALRANTPCCFVLALRADFYGALMDSELWPQAGMSRLDIAPLRGKALAEAITAPALRVGVHLEARLSDRLVTDAAGEPGVLPLVQETLRMLWDRRRHRYLGLAAYEALGQGGRGLDVAIALRANTAMNELTDPQQAIARRVLLRVVSFGEGRADTRRQLGLPALRSAADDEAALSHVLQHLVAHRLITVDGDPASEPASREALVDLSHEALITGWPEFRRWIDGRRADEQRRRRLEGKVSEWIERGRGTASLLDAVELVEAVHWIESDAAREVGHPAELADLSAASRAMHTRQRRRRRGVIAGIFVALVGVAVVVALLALAERDQANIAREQTAKAKASDSESKQRLAQLFEELGRQELVEKDHPQEAIPYFLEARRNGLDTPSLRMMFGAAARQLPLVPAIAHYAIVRSSAFSPDSTRVATSSDDHTARVWDAATGKPVTPPLAHQDSVWGVAFSPDGTRVVTASYDKTARVWDAATGKPVTPPLAHQDSVWGAAFSPDGTRVVTASEDHTAQVWDAATGQPVTPPLEHQDSVWGAAFSPDGTRVVTASDDKTARVWDAATGQPVTAPLAHQARVASAAFSPDGTRVITASDDKTARVWDAATGQPVTAPLAHQAEVKSCRVQPGRYARGHRER